MSNENFVRLTEAEKYEQMKTAPIREPNETHLVPEPIDFVPTGETVFATTKQLEKSIAAFLQAGLSELAFVGIAFNDGFDKTIPSTIPYGEFYVNLYFSPRNVEQEFEPVVGVVTKKNPDGTEYKAEAVIGKQQTAPYKSVYAIGGNNSGNKSTSSKMLEELYRINGQSRNRCSVYQINNITKKVLSKYLFEDPRKVDWRMHTVEIEDKSNIYSNNGNYYVGVIGLSLGKFIDDIYGPTDQNGGPIDYRISLVRNIMAGYYAGSRNYIVAIHRMSRAAVKRLAEMANVYPGPQIQFGTQVTRK